MTEQYDLVIVGGGISGASLLYTTAKFTDIESIALIEKESEIAAINTDCTNNSQTLHFGAIETNYALEKAESVKEGAEMLAGSLEHHDPDREFHAKRSKMVLGVGDEEVAELEKRYHEEGFGNLYPKLEPIEREEIAQLEPKVVEGRDEDKELLALQAPDGYVVDYGQTARSMVEQTQEEDGVDLFTGTEVTTLEETDDGYRLETTDADGHGADTTFESDFAVVVAGSHSLQIAKDLGYGEDKVLLPIAGSFFLAEDFLNGKVYTLQLKKLPFAAVHGDADVHDPSITRFGPTAKLVPTLERGRLSTVGDFLDVFGLNVAAFHSYASILADRILLPYILKNLVYDLPRIGERTFLPNRSEGRPLRRPRGHLARGGLRRRPSPDRGYGREVSGQGRGEDRRRRRHLQHHALAGCLHVSQERDAGHPYSPGVPRRRVRVRRGSVPRGHYRSLPVRRRGQSAHCHGFGRRRRGAGDGRLTAERSRDSPSEK